MLPTTHRLPTQPWPGARRGEADALMKGHLNTDVLLRALLNKEHGLLPQGSVMTHISVAELPNYPKLLFFSDAAVIPFPNTEQRLAQVGYVVRLCHAARHQRAARGPHSLH